MILLNSLFYNIETIFFPFLGGGATFGNTCLMLGHIYDNMIHSMKHTYHTFIRVRKCFNHSRMVKSKKINKYKNVFITYAFVLIRMENECLPMHSSSILRTMNYIAMASLSFFFFFFFIFFFWFWRKNATSIPPKFCKDAVTDCLCSERYSLKSGDSLSVLLVFLLIGVTKISRFNPGKPFPFSYFCII